MAERTTNSLLSTTRASDTSPTVQLHPLVLLTISDSLTRHTLRQQQGPVVGAILGQQNGQEVTMEVAFQARLVENENNEVVLDDEWFSKRLDDFRDVHKSPQLDLVAWFTLGPSTGPEAHILLIHNRISELYLESPILLLFHPADAPSEATAAGKLPLTIYESVYQNPSGAPDDKAMDIDGAAQQGREVKFRELVYTIETGEAEMISVDFVARGGGNATAIEAKDEGAGAKKATEEKNTKGKGKGKDKEKDQEKEDVIDEEKVLSADDEELLSSLSAKSNAIRMLSRRITLLRSYLASLPSSYLSDPSLPFSSPAPTESNPLPLNHAILRSISALLARIPILSPADTAAFNLESQQEQSDVQLVALLSSITNSVHVAKEAGRKHQVVEMGKSQGRRGGQFGLDGPHHGGGQFFDTILGNSSGGGFGGIGLSGRGGAFNLRE